MQGEVDEQQPNEIISEFGYYPVEVNIETEQFSLRTLPGLIEKVERINNDKNVVNGWIYPGNREVYNLNGDSCTMPYSYRVFGMPKTHTLKLKKHILVRNSQLCCVVPLFFQGYKIDNH